MKAKLLTLTAVMLLASLNAYSTNCKPDSMISYNYVVGTMVKNKSTKVIYQYGSNGEKLKENLYRWSDSLSVWEKWRTNEYAFDGNGRRIQEIQKYWDGSNWVDQFRNSYQYNATGSVSQHLQQLYNTGTGVWNNTYKIDVAFNSANDTLQELRQNWNNGNWESDYKIDYTYSLDTLKVRILQVWYQGSWANVWKEEYTYNNIGTVDMLVLSRIINGNFSMSTVTTYVYQDGHLIQSEFREFDPAGPDWKKPYRYSYIYNTNGCLTLQNTDIGTTIWPASSFNPVYQYEYFVSGLASVNENDLTTLKCFPVPATNCLTITAEQQTGLSGLVITNTIGQLMPVEYLSNNETSKTINVQNYPDGIYMLHTKNATLRFVKQ